MATASVSIRRANQKDVPLLITLWKEYWPEETRDTILKPYRGRSIGSGLVREASRWSRQRKLKHLGLTVFCGNRHAEEIYRGWNFVGVNQFMRKPL